MPTRLINRLSSLLPGRRPLRAPAPARPASQAPERVLVTGGAGYIGSRLVPRLLRAGRQVRVLDRLDFGAAGLDAVAGESNLEVLEGDIRDPAAVARALVDIDAVIHLASIVGDPACADESLQAEEINVDGAALVAAAAAERGVRRIILASTCSVYGSNPDIVDERSALNPVSLYARSKIAAETAVLAVSSRRCSVAALRIGTAFGWSSRPRFDLFVNLLTAKARFEKPGHHLQRRTLAPLRACGGHRPRV